MTNASRTPAACAAVNDSTACGIAAHPRRRHRRDRATGRRTAHTVAGGAQRCSSRRCETQRTILRRRMTPRRRRIQTMACSAHPSRQSIGLGGTEEPLPLASSARWSASSARRRGRTDACRHADFVVSSSGPATSAPRLTRSIRAPATTRQLDPIRLIVSPAPRRWRSFRVDDAARSRRSTTDRPAADPTSSMSTTISFLPFLPSTIPLPSIHLLSSFHSCVPPIPFQAGPPHPASCWFPSNRTFRHSRWAWSAPGWVGTWAMATWPSPDTRNHQGTDLLPWTLPARQPLATLPCLLTTWHSCPFALRAQFPQHWRNAELPGAWRPARLPPDQNPSPGHHHRRYSDAGLRDARPSGVTHTTSRHQRALPGSRRKCRQPETQRPTPDHSPVMPGKVSAGRWVAPRWKECPAASHAPTPSPGQYHRR